MAPASTIPVSHEAPHDCYHGTSAENAKGIEVTPGLFKFTLPPDDRESRYGRGVYFWRGSKESAIWWAKRNKTTNLIVVFCGKVLLGKHLDIATREGQNILISVARHFKQQPPSKNFKCTEAAILTFLATVGLIETAQVVDLGADVTTSQPLFEGAVSRPTRLIICVYKVDNILEVQKVLEQATNPP